MPVTPPWRWVVVATTVVVAAAFGAVALAPAALVDARIAELSQGSVRLTDTSGSVWRGQGVLAAGATRIPVGWQIDPWGLAHGELRVAIAPGLDARAGTPRGEITLASGRLAVADLDLTMPASLIAQVAAPATQRLWSADGEIGLRIAAMEWAPPASRGVALLSWRGARLSGAGGLAALDLGAVTATLTANGDHLSGPVANAGGDLAVSGVIDVRAHDSLRAALVLKPSRRDDVAMSQLLSAIAREDAAGWHVDWRVPLQ
jgi:hypothetical protein